MFSPDTRAIISNKTCTGRGIVTKADRGTAVSNEEVLREWATPKKSIAARCCVVAKKLKKAC